MHLFSLFCEVWIKIIQTCYLADHCCFLEDWSVILPSLMPILAFCVPQKICHSSQSRKFCKTAVLCNCWDQHIVQLIEMGNGHASTRRVHHNHDSGLTVVEQIWEPGCDIKTLGRLKDKIHCYGGKKKKNNQHGSRYNWFGWEDACCNCYPVLRQNSSRSSVIENQVVRKLKDFLQFRRGCYHLRNWLFQAFISSRCQISWLRKLLIFLWCYLDVSKCKANFHWFEFPNYDKNTDVCKLISNPWSVAWKSFWKIKLKKWEVM